MSKELKFLSIIFGLTFFAGSLYGQPVSRHILALYDSQKGQTSKKNHIHEKAEMILNHLGCIIEYWDINKGLPDDRQMRKYGGVLTWFYNNSMSRPQAYLKWAVKQLDAGRKFVVLGNLSVFKDARSGEFLEIDQINQLCKRIGFIITNSNWTENPTRIELVSKETEMVEFERSLDFELTNYQVYQPTHPQSKIYLKLKRNDVPNSESALVFTTPQGGLAATGYVFYENKTSYKKQWRINPFKFFEEAFDLKGRPRPDVTTLNGQRIWCSHIDGDALTSRSEIKPNTYCGEIIRDEILAKYKWPVSVSVVVGEAETDSKFQDIARSIYRLDWVEAASHSYSHPFYWADDYEHKDQYSSRHLPINGYKFNLQDEIIGSVNYINKRLLPPNKKVEQFFWTGNCEPTWEALRLCKKLKINNINGRDTVFDKANPSYTNVAPLSIDVGGFRQIYAPNSNENIYTNEWKGPYYGFKSVLETFKNTESPVRIKPIDIYYHFFIGEKWAGLNSLKEVLSKTMAMDVAPMFISDYIEVVQGFFSARTVKVSQDVWKIKNYGECTTIRFDETQKFPDLSRSIHVLGFHHYQGSLYVHLDNGDEAVIVLTGSKPKATYLAQGSHRVFNWRASKQKVSFSARGFGMGRFAIANLLQNATYRVSLLNGAETLTLQTNETGTLIFKRPMAGPLSITIKLIKAL